MSVEVQQIKPRRPKAMSAVMMRKSSSVRSSSARSSSARPSSARPSTGRQRRPYSAYTNRQDEENSATRYDQPNTNREWWRYYLRDTPTPGSYQIKDFLSDLHKKYGSYGFRDAPRSKKPVDCQRKGELLLPGAYHFKDFLEESSKKLQTFSFKAVDRENTVKIGHGYGDKELNTSPDQYNVVDYHEGPRSTDRKTSAFKSMVTRRLEDSAQFRISQAPGPGRYNSFTKKTNTGSSSAFKSKVPRFPGKVSKIPGPGSYSIGCEQPPPLPAVVAHMSDKHDIKMI